MVVGCHQYVETGVVNGGEEFVGCAESRITFIGLSTQSNFQIGYGKIYTPNFFFHVFKASGVIISPCCGTCSIDLSLMLHEIAYEKKPQGVGRHDAVGCRQSIR